MEIGDKLYRYNEYVYEDGQVSICDTIYTVRKLTRCGVRIAPQNTSDYIIERGWYKTKFVNLSTNKKFAHPTKEAAMESFIARKNRQISILEWQIKIARKSLSAAVQMVTP